MKRDMLDEADFRKGVESMSKSRKYTYWLDFIDCFHYDEKTKTFTYDDGLPSGVIESCRAWCKINKCNIK